MLLRAIVADTADGAVEFESALKIVNVPTELVFCRDETHLLHQPRHRAWAMRLGLQWFDYWLRGQRDPEPANGKQYQRWTATVKKWHPPKRSVATDSFK